jgi:hypothetical protein
MSHVSTVKVEVKNLKALKKACEALGLIFKENQKKYKWYGTHVGDYPLPEGFKKEDLGKCEHAIGVKGNNSAYEIGLCKNRNGKDGYTMLWDFWAGGQGLEACVGKDCNKLIHEYTKEVAKGQLTSMTQYDGWSMNESVNEAGETVLTLRKY